jgi:hypothetical protein
MGRREVQWTLRDRWAYAIPSTIVPEAAQLACRLGTEEHVTDQLNLITEDRNANAACGRVLAMCLAGCSAGIHAITYGMVHSYTIVEPWQAHEARHITIFVEEALWYPDSISLLWNGAELLDNAADLEAVAFDALGTPAGAQGAR